MLSTVTPVELVTMARQLVGAHDAGPTGVWPRAGALLVRQALELSMQRLWELRAPGLQLTSARCQLLCLGPILDDPALAGSVSTAWWGLTQACHHQPYDLAPTVGELLGWLAAAEALALSVDTQRAAAGLDRTELAPGGE